MKRIFFLKAHVRGYTRADGTPVREHDDSRSYAYHGTTQKNLRFIRKEGLMPNPASAGSRVWLAETESYADNHAGQAAAQSVKRYDPEKVEAAKAVLRVRREHLPPDHEMVHSGHIGTRQTIPPHHLEIRGENGSWSPLVRGGPNRGA
jgi:hypothetical protein